MTELYAIFCADPLNPNAVDESYSHEASVANQCGFRPVSIDHDYLDRYVDAESALRKSKFAGAGLAVYRGWMMGVDAYSALHSALLGRDIRLLTTPKEYEACHHAPANYDRLAQWMPKTVWLEKEYIGQPAALSSVIEVFGNEPVVLKDWVKSQASGYWKDACFIPDASDAHSVARIVERFCELQAEYLTGGLVFKKYIPLLPLNDPPFEYRAFIHRGHVIGCWPRSIEAAQFGGPPNEMLIDIAKLVPSPFASADFGCDAEGRWWLLEVGDGQVSGLPDPSAARPLFEALSGSGMICK